MGVTDWVAKMLQLPEVFLNSHEGHGAGMIQVNFTEKYEYPMICFNGINNKQDMYFVVKARALLQNSLGL